MSETVCLLVFRGLRGPVCSLSRTLVPQRGRRKPAIRAGTAVAAPGSIGPVTVPPEHREFARQVGLSALQDPMPAFHNLSDVTGVAVDDLVHHALVSWVSAGAEALLSLEPQALQRLVEARRREDWEAVAGIVDWLASGRG